MPGEYKISDIYEGGYSSLDPEYGNLFVGYRVPVESLGITTNPQEARVAQEVSSKINLGAKNVEVELLLPKTFDAMNKHDFKEINRLSKLTGIDVSFHGPLVEPSGMTQQGFTESSREAAERQILEAIERVHEANPKGGIINFHTSNMFPAPDITMSKEGEKVEGLIVVDSERGNIGKIKLKERYFPEEGKVDIQKEINHYNEESWNQQLTQLGYAADRATDFIKHAEMTLLGKEAEEKAGKRISEQEKQALLQYNIGKNYLNDSYRQLKDLYEAAYKNSTPEEREILEDFSRKIQEKVKKINKDPKSKESIELRKQIIEEGLNVFDKISPPKIYKPLDEFMLEKTATTFGNVAFNAYKKFKDKAPILVVENPPANQQFARGEDLKKIIEESRKRFIEQAVKEGISKSEARAQAEKLIGASWDVGHINMLRQYGFEEKDILKETEKVAPYVKHIHLSDNFGFEHTELPMGMGNVPIKEIMKKLGKKGFEAKKIIEAGDWWTQHTPKGGGAPFTPSLEAMGSPLYSMEMAPYWNQSIAFQQGYLSMPLLGESLPQVNYQTFGAGFSHLPAELGGQMPGAAGSRVSGRPME